jgi:hypothetical protein
LVDEVRNCLGIPEAKVDETNDLAAVAEMIRQKALKIVIFSYGLEGAHGGADLAKLASQNKVSFINFVYRDRKKNHIIQTREAGLYGARGIFYDSDFIGKPASLIFQEFIRLIKSAII